MRFPLVILGFVLIVIGGVSATMGIVQYIGVATARWDSSMGEVIEHEDVTTMVAVGSRGDQAPQDSVRLTITYPVVGTDFTLITDVASPVARDSYPIGSEHEVFFASDNPSTAILTEPGTSIMPWFLIGVGGVISMFGMGLFVLGAKKTH